MYYSQCTSVVENLSDVAEPELTGHGDSAAHFLPLMFRQEAISGATYVCPCNFYILSTMKTFRLE